MTDEAKTQLFYDFVTKSEDMEPLKAMKLLTKACMDYVGVSRGYRTMAYYAGWNWMNEFNKTGHPLVEQTKDMAFAEVMPLICSDYSEEDYEAFDVSRIDPQDEEKIYIK